MVGPQLLTPLRGNAPALIAWILERYKIFQRKESGMPKPWTEDKILRQYSFCNVHRENDRVTRWIGHNWRSPLHKAEHPDLWFFMVIARLINWPETLAELGARMGQNVNGWEWDEKLFVEVLQRRKNAGLKAFGGAYIVSTNGRTMDKAEYLASHVLDFVWRKRDTLRPRKNERLEDFHKRLMLCDGLGSFMAAQVVADVKYTAPLSMAPDWWTWAAPGPGSLRGLNRLCGRDKDTRWAPREWFDTLTALRELVNNAPELQNVPELHAQDLQNCLCEFDKYERTRLGEGRPRATYPGEK